MALLMERAERCTMCGTAPWEWEADKFAFEATRETCLGCAQKDLLRDDDQKPPAGSSVVLIPKKVARERRRRAKT